MPNPSRTLGVLCLINAEASVRRAGMLDERTHVEHPFGAIRKRVSGIDDHTRQYLRNNILGKGNAPCGKIVLAFTTASIEKTRSVDFRCQSGNCLCHLAVRNRKLGLQTQHSLLGVGRRLGKGAQHWHPPPCQQSSKATVCGAADRRSEGLNSLRVQRTWTGSSQQGHFHQQGSALLHSRGRDYAHPFLSCGITPSPQKWPAKHGMLACTLPPSDLIRKGEPRLRSLLLLLHLLLRDRRFLFLSATR
mmetsp:Transcript_24637/g.43934  ORF Transcript_24637/g.43934 Transcript_24637/m.43934 type:complete len:247 (+) Transcript_24637:405-1145(+)